MLPDAKFPRFSETLGSWVAPEAEPVCAGHRQDGGASAMASNASFVVCRLWSPTVALASVLLAAVGTAASAEVAHVVGLEGGGTGRGGR